MPLNLENYTASHCSEFTGAVNLYKKKLSPVLSSDLEGANTLFASFQATRTKTGPISDFSIHDSRTDCPKWQECHSFKLLNTGFQEDGEDYFDETNHWQKGQDFRGRIPNSFSSQFLQLFSPSFSKMQVNLILLRKSK